MPDTADDLMGNNLQIFVSKTFDALRAEVWPPEVNQAETSASCDVENHGTGLVSVAFIRNSGAVATDQLVKFPPEGSVPPYDRLERSHAGVRGLIREHLTYMLPRLQEIMRRDART